MTTIHKGLEEIQKLLKNRYFDTAQAQKRYGINSIGFTRSLLGGCTPINNEEIIQIVSIANQNQIALYPLSTGHNWGYGGSTPPTDNAFVLDLSLMNRIIDIDVSTGSITIEPGVTQGQLKQFLDEKKLPFMVPVTGAGPSCSLLGNALDRGYGLTPITDHFYSIISIEAILANGEIYRSSLSDLNAFASNRLYKWGIGPYLDGLFAQGNIGIVTSATLALASYPEAVEGFLFYIDSNDNFIDCADEIRKIHQEVGLVLGSIKITNQHRLLAITEFLPEKVHSDNLMLNDPEIIEFLKKKNIPLWLGSGVLIGKNEFVRAAKKIIRKRLKKYVHKIMFLNPGRFNHLTSILNKLPIINKLSFTRVCNKLNLFLKLMSGIPNEIALPIAYFKSGNPTEEYLNPDRDGCGLIWFSPLLPIQSKSLKSFLEIIYPICIKNKIEPVITVSTLSERCFDSAVPLLFNRENAESIDQAHHCYRELFQECHKQGFVPYRLPANFMNLAVNKESNYWQFVKKIKAAVDPNSIIAPGRYSIID